MSIFDGFSAKELDILRARAQRVAQAAHEEAPQDLLTALTVMVGEERYALPVEAIANVYEDVMTTPIPCAPAYVAGVANIRGHIIVALDLAALLGVPHEAEGERATLAVLADGELKAAFQVGSLLGVESLPTGELASIPANVALRHAGYVQGVLPDGTVLLNVDAILNDPELIVSTGQS